MDLNQSSIIQDDEYANIFDSALLLYKVLDELLILLDLSGRDAFTAELLQ